MYVHKYKPRFGQLAVLLEGVLTAKRICLMLRLMHLTQGTNAFAYTRKRALAYKP